MKKARFYAIKVSDVKKETHDTVSIKLDIPEDLKDIFAYTQGQYLTFKVPGHEHERRSYSLCSSPLEGEWQVAVKQVPGGLFSTYANQTLKPSDVLEVMPPMGNFYTKLSPEHKKSYVLFAAGSGITPILSIIKSILYVEPSSQCSLFYVNKTSSSIIFKEALEGLKSKYLDRFSLHYLLSRERMDSSLFQGRLDQAKCSELLELIAGLKKADEYFICGPYDMILGIKKALLNHGIEEHKIHFELFTTPEQQNKKRKDTEPASGVTNYQGPTAKITIHLDGVSTQFELGYHQQSILDAANAKGLDLPFSCKGGVCCTCKAKLLEGEVEMDVNYALEEDEIENGYILTCQAHPRSETILIDFDQG